MNRQKPVILAIGIGIICTTQSAWPQSPGRGLSGRPNSTPAASKSQATSRPELPELPDLSSRPGAAHASPSASPFSSQSSPTRLSARSNSSAGRTDSLARQRSNTQRQFDQRTATADRLRNLSERSGNARLVDAADRMDENAQKQMHKRTQRIDQQEGQSNGITNDDATTPDESETQAASRTGSSEPRPSLRERMRRIFTLGRRRSQPPVNTATAAPRQESFDRQRQVQQRILDHRIQTADHLRQVGERNGNERLEQVADRMQGRAETQQTHRIERIDARQQRFAPSPPPSAPTGDAPPSADAPGESTTPGQSESPELVLPDSPSETDVVKP